MLTGGRVVALLGIGAGQVEADLAAAACQACRETMKVETISGLHRSVSVAECHGCRDLVDTDVGGAERSPMVVAVLTEAIGGPLSLSQGAVGGGAVELSCCSERIGQVQAADNRQPCGIIVPA